MKIVSTSLAATLLAGVSFANAGKVNTLPAEALNASPLIAQSTTTFTQVAQAQTDAEKKATMMAKEAEMKAAEAAKKAEMMAAEEAKKKEMMMAEEAKQAEMKAAEAAKKAEMMAAEEAKKKEMMMAEEAKQAEMKAAEATKKAEMMAAEEAKKKEMMMAEEAKQAEMKAAEATKKAEMMAAEEATKKEAMMADEKKKSMMMAAEACESAEYSVTGFGNAITGAGSIADIAAEIKTLAGDNACLIEITGYSSKAGPKSINMALSEDRAEWVKSQLMEAGVNVSQTSAAGAGETSQFGNNSANRRVVITVK